MKVLYKNKASICNNKDPLANLYKFSITKGENLVLLIINSLIIFNRKIIILIITKMA